MAMAFASRKGISALFRIFVDDTPVAVVGLSDICRFHKRANLWFALGDMRYGGKGIIRAGSSQVIRYGFNDLDLHTVYGWTIQPNQPAARILVANRFVYYGTQVEAFCFDGKFVDILWFNLTRSE